MKKDRFGQPGALELAEEAVQLLRKDPVAFSAPYYIGTLPFVMGLLYFWTEGKHDPTGELLWESACVLALTFAWMKSWQALFCSRLTTHLQGDIPESWTLRRIVRLIAVQTALQPWSLFFLPFALLLAAPFGWIYSFYESLTVVGDGRSEPLSTVCSRAWQQAKLWPAQNHCIIWLLSPYLLLWVAAMLLWGIPIFQSAIPEWSLGILWLTGSLAALLMLALSPLAVVTGINLAIALSLLPSMTKTLLGVETQLTLSPSNMVNSTLLAVTCALVWLALDPVLKTVYVLRCFYGESRRSALDLRAELKSLQLERAGGMLTLMLLAGSFQAGPLQAQSQSKAVSHKSLGSPTQSCAQQAPVAVSSRSSALQSNYLPPDALRRSIEEALASPDYTWRPPTGRPSAQRHEGWLFGMLHRLTDQIRRWFRALRQWIDDLSKKTRSGSAQTSASGHNKALRLFTMAAIMLLVLAIGFLFWRHRIHSRLKPVQTARAPENAVPDLRQEYLPASQLPEDGWLQLAGEFLKQGQPRLALRAFYLSSLAHLEQRSLLTTARHKSNQDYLKELERRAHSYPDLSPAFADNVALFERGWYGFHEVTRELLALFRSNLERMRSSAL
jgi:hypothetical protein